MRAGELQTLYLCLGDTQMMLERHADAAKSYDEAYQWVLRTPNNPTCRPIAACIETLENIAVTNINHHMDEAGVWVDRMDSLVTIYEKEPKPEETSSEEQVPVEELTIVKEPQEERDYRPYQAVYV